MIDKKNVRFNDGGGDLNKRWYIEWKENGKRRRIAVSGKTKDARYKRYRDLMLGLAPSPKPIWYRKMEKKITTFLKSNRPIWRKKTYQGYSSKLRQFMKFASSYEHLETLDEVIEMFFESRKQKLNPTTYNDYITLLSRLWELKNVHPLKSNPVPARYFSVSQAAFISKKIKQKNKDLWVFVQAIYYCFIRPAELRQLKVGHLIMEEGKILIPSKISKNKKEQYVAIPKCFLPILQEYIEGKLPNQYVFGTGKRMIGINTMSRRHQVLLQKLDIDTNRYKLYSWKHTGVVTAYRAGIGLKELQIQLRHHSLDQVNEYMRQLGAWDLGSLTDNFPEL